VNEISKPAGRPQHKQADPYPDQQHRHVNKNYTQEP
jgi:hypothetical protein